MFKKLLNSLKKCFIKHTPDENVRELQEGIADECKSETGEKTKKHKRRKKMADEKKVKEEVETSKVDETADNKVEEKSTEKVEKTEDKVETPANEEKTETKEETTEEEQSSQNVQETEPTGNGVPLEELVTKEQLHQVMQAFEAKFAAVVKENEDLKNQLSKAKEETDGLKEKYENKDFGNFNKQGVIAKDKQANETFDEYSKQFMS